MVRKTYKGIFCRFTVRDVLHSLVYKPLAGQDVFLCETIRNVLSVMFRFVSLVCGCFFAVWGEKIHNCLKY